MGAAETFEQARRRRILLVGALGAALAGMVGFVISRDAVGRGWEQLPYLAAAAAALTAMPLWWLVMERRQRFGVVRGALVGTAAALLAHYPCWYLAVLEQNVSYWLLDRSGASVADPPVGLLTGLFAAFVFSLGSWLLYGWLTAFVGAVAAALFTWSIRPKRGSPPAGPASRPNRAEAEAPHSPVSARGRKRRGGPIDRPLSWLVDRLEREFPVEAFKRTAAGERIKKVAATVAGSFIGLALVAFAITVLAGNPEDFLFVTGLLAAAGAAVAVLTFGSLLVASLVMNQATGGGARLFALEQATRLRLRCTPEESLEFSRRALARLPQGSVPRPELSSADTLVVKTGPSRKSFGEAVTIKMAPRDDGTIQLTVHSGSWIGATLFDWGINADNVRFLADDLKTAAPVAGD